MAWTRRADNLSDRSQGTNQHDETSLRIVLDFYALQSLQLNNWHFILYTILNTVSLSPAVE